MTDNFAGARALVVGGSSGIGLATAQHLAASGATVTIASRGHDHLSKAVDFIGHGAVAQVLDATDDAAVAQFFAASGAFDHIVVSVSAAYSGPVRTLPLEQAYASMQSKFWGAYRVARAAQFAPGGSLTLVSGFLSRRPNANAVLQSVINASVEALTRGLALELAPIRVNCVSPGLIDTPRHDRMEPAIRQQFYENTAAKLPVKRIGAADDVAAAILFLAANPFATGSVVMLDGGGSIA